MTKTSYEYIKLNLGLLQGAAKSTKLFWPLSGWGYIIAGGENLPRQGIAECSMALTREEVLHVAQLARLSLGAEEIELFTRQLNDILDYVAKLQELDTTGVSPLGHVAPLANVFREDVVRDSLSRDLSLANAPAREEGTFVVPRII